MLTCELKWDIFEEALAVLWMQLIFPASLRMQLMIRAVLDEELMIMGTASSPCVCVSARGATQAVLLAAEPQPWCFSESLLVSRLAFPVLN